MNGYCAKSGKHIHETRAKAVAQLRSIKKHFPNYGGKIYPCQYCKGFHVGRLQKPSPKRRRTMGHIKHKLGNHRREET